MPVTVCPRCEEPLPADSPEGLCPRCLLQPELVLDRIGDQKTTPAEPPGSAAPSAADLTPFFPQLEILELLGQGGMGAVYKARQVKLGRLVALKVLTPQVSHDPAFAERFLREARALARLSHPHIVTVHDFGDAGGQYYLLMEYVDGVNLRQAMQAGRLTPGQTLALVRDLCEALQYAHEMGVVHRDIKPENILLDRQGRLKIADFGLAKLLDAAQPATRLTGTRQAMGTLHYVAPEQMEQPAAVDHRADIYSLGIVFYELLTGELPLGKFLPPSEKADVDGRVDNVVLRAIEREPDRRYQRMTEMKTAVEEVKDGRHPVSRPAAGPLSPGRLALEVTATVLLAALAVPFFYLLWEYRAAVSPKRWYHANFVLFIAMIICLAGDFPSTSRLVRRLLAMTGLGTLVSWVLYFASQERDPGMVEGVSGVLVGVWFGARLVESFRTSGTAEEAGGTAALPVPPLPPGVDKLRGLLSTHSAALNYLISVLPNLDSAELGSARKVCQVLPEEHVLAILNYAGPEEEFEHGVVFGYRGLYYRNADDSARPGLGQISYAELASRPVVNHGEAVYLGNDQFICPQTDDTGIECELLAQVLLEVKGLCETFAPDPAGN